MNTPKTPKPPRRWKPPKRDLSQFRGGFFGITEPNMASVFGSLMSYWPHVEEQIIVVFEELISGKDATTDYAINRASRAIFRSLVSQKARITIMKSLLEYSPHNIQRTELYDAIISEFDSLNDIRNEYIHGLWMWNENDEILSFWRTSFEDYFNIEPRAVKIEELSSVLNRMRDLVEKICRRHGPLSSP